MVLWVCSAQELRLPKCKLENEVSWVFFDEVSGGAHGRGHEMIEILSKEALGCFPYSLGCFDV